jgi:hypothetical protein
LTIAAVGRVADRKNRVSKHKIITFQRNLTLHFWRVKTKKPVSSIAYGLDMEAVVGIEPAYTALQGDIFFLIS